uniref:Uncharacterized protein n=1 Tax=Anguilla anguilla TaxID=7936 RepID=A0A0E9Q5Z4_ANGAN
MQRLPKHLLCSRVLRVSLYKCLNH